MKNKFIKVIDSDNLPTGFPVFKTITIWLLLDRLDASDIVRGIVWTMVVLYWFWAIYRFILQNPVDLFKQDNHLTNEESSKNRN